MKTRHSIGKNKIKSGAFIVIAAVITAIAIAVTCAMFGFSSKNANGSLNVGEQDVYTSTAHTANTAGTHDFTPAGKLNNGDTISLAYCNGQQALNLPQGRYKLEVWGAQGGCYSANAYGGYGGYTYGEIQFTKTTTLYVNIGGGGQHQANAKTRAYNGGGAIENGHPGGGGGGASHMATSSGVLSALGAGNNNILIVAGGGGGVGCRCNIDSVTYCGAGGGGHNAGTSAPANKHSTNRGGGYAGTLTEGGNGGAGNGSAKGAFGLGGNQTYTQTSTGGGAGGGGYYGGGSGGADSANDYDDGPGGGGSGYINSSRMISGTTGGTTGAWGAASATASSGKALVTAINVNQPPANAGANKTAVTIAGRARGTSGNTTITPDNIAVDPDATKTTLHFTDGSSSNLESFPTTANTGLFLNSGCSASSLATNYIDWTWGNSRTLNITNFKKYPRNGVDGCTANGVLTLYARVRDSFGSATQHGWSDIQFKVTVPATIVSKKSETVATAAGSYKLGLSTTTSLDASGNAPSTGIYHPTATNEYTAFIDKSLRIGEPFTIRASELLGGVYSGDSVVISLNSTADVSSSVTSRKYKINELDGDSGYTGHGVSAFNASKAQIANAFDQISITSISPEPGYKVFPVTLYVVEKNTAYTDRPNNVVPDIEAVSLDIVFRMENSRPYINNYHNVVDIDVGETKELQLSTFFSDADGAITASTHTIKSVIVPKREFIQLDRHATVVATTGGNAGYYNVGAASGQVFPTTSATFTTTAQGDEPTTFDPGIVYNQTAGGADNSATAFMRFTYANDKLTVIGLRSSFSQYTSSRAANAPGHFYLLLNLQDKCEIEDEGIWLPIAFRIGKEDSYDPVDTVTSPGALTGQAASNVYPAADGGRGGSFYFAPMAINVNGSNVVGRYKSADENGNNIGALTNAVLSPLALDGDNFATANGVADWGGKLNEFLRIDDRTTSLRSIAESVSTDGVTTGTDDFGNEYAQNYYIRVQYINIYVEKSLFAQKAYGGGRVVVGSGSTADDQGFAYIELESENIDGVDYFITKGIKLTLRSATMNRYFYAGVDICDAKGNPVTGVEIAIRTRNTSPVADDGSNVATFGNPARGNAYSTYNASGVDSVPTVTYRIPYGARVVVTPYDFVSDEDMYIRYGSSVRPVGGFTLNGLTGRFDAATGTLSTSATSGPVFNGVFDRQTYGSPDYIDSLTSDNGMLRVIGRRTTVASVSKTTAGTLVGSEKVTNESVFGDRLYFARNDSGTDAYTYNPVSFDNFVYSAPAETNNIVYNFGSTVTFGSESFGVDFIMVTAMNRTLQPITIEMKVRDRFGDSSDGTASFTVRIVIEVVNTAPTVKNENLFYELATTAISTVTPPEEEGGEPITNVVTPTSIRLSSNGNGDNNGLMTDVDRDAPEFITSRGTLIANTKTLADIYPDITSFDEVDEQYTKYDGRSLTQYMTASLLTQYTLSVTALNPTKAIESGVYVYFFVSDGNGGTSLGFVQIEVLNTAPILNTSPENGFNESDPLWAIESTGLTDIIRPRYIVGTDSVVNELKSVLGAIDSDIKVLTTDSDALHGKTVLSPRIDGVQSFDYVNMDDVSQPSETKIRATVPSVADATGFSSSTAPAAVLLYTSDNGEITTGAPEGYTAQILFYVGGRWLEREQLIVGLTGGTVAGVAAENFELSRYFDIHGRWIFTDWALRLRAEDGFGLGVKLGITLSLRDEAALGGDTAGRTTAFNSDRRLQKTDVYGSFKTTVFQTISRTGIRTKDEYAKYNDYYVVEYTRGNSVTPYVSTYDGRTDSPYVNGDNVSRLAYNTVGGHNILAADGSNEIKARALGSADNTLAGTNSGVVYNADNIDTVAGAYRYPSVIEVPTDSELGTTTREVYVPMSYFGQLSDLVTISDDGDVVYRDDYVGYNVGGDQPFSTGNLSDFVMALSLSDGSSVWEGSNIADNPYINVDAFDLSVADAPTRAETVQNSISSMYYNNRLAVTTVDANGYLSGYEKQKDVNGKSFVGDGNLMYLEGQADGLREHNFGLVFSKKNVRTSTRNLSLTIKLARSNGTKNTIKDVAADTRSVTVSLHVENAKIDLFAGDSYAANALNHDGNTYYYDLTMPTADTAEFALVRRNIAGEVETIPGHDDAHGITYTDTDYDGDYTGVKYGYRDRAYFLADSFGMLSKWTGGADAYGRVNALDETGNAFANTAATTRAQNSVAHYFGKSDAAGAANVEDTHQPNGGIYGSNVYGPSGTEGYSSYFTASLSENGRVLNIVSGRKTLINEIAIERLLGANPTQQQVKALYEKRGLVATYADANVDPASPTRVYYPFKVLVYDSCGAGWFDASYVSVEIRITITNADPTIRNVGTAITDEAGRVTSREYGIDLAVGNSVTINLYDIVSDADIFVQGQSGYYTLATKKNFETAASGISLESGDYLESPYANDSSLGRPYNPRPLTNASGNYYYDGGGFSLMGATDRDVIMWMETARDVTVLDRNTVPSSNNISFTVNRRTTGVITDIEDGHEVNKSVAINEYRFTLRFYDSLGQSTIDFVFVITIKNQTPEIVAPARNFTMRSGDELTVLTTYYDNFIGGVANGSVAYNNSSTKLAYDAHISAGNYNGDGINKDTQPERWRYSQITSAKQDELIFDSTGQSAGGGIHLGYLALADDDTPWRMRITNVQYNSLNNPRLWVEECFSLPAEGDVAAGGMQRMAIRIDARAACENEPVTITVSDGERGVITCTLYITVVSSKPVARDDGTAEDRALISAAGLETTDTTGTFRMFTVPTGTKAATDSTSQVVKQFDIDGFGTKTARSMFTINLSNIARDPDGANETSGMTLYRDGSFKLNGVEIVRGNDRVYHTDYFDIRVANGGRSFTLTATDFNPDARNGYEELSFLIADAGNGDFENTLAITFRIYTMYSDMTNPTVAAMSTADYSTYLTGANKIFVKSYDDYYGSASSRNSELAFVKLDGNDGNDGNTESYIVDPDYSVSGEKTYTARLYAFIDHNDETGNWEAVSAAELAQKFVRAAENKTFALNGEDHSQYFIGGITYSGTKLVPQGDAKTRLDAVNKYVEFEFKEDGTGLLLTPKAATLGTDKILLYIETEKYVGGLRLNPRDPATLRAGALYMLDVRDSAPTAVKEVGTPEGVNFTARGAKGDSVTFKIHDPANPFGALFTDSDNGDIVTIAPISDADYERSVLAAALRADPDLDWAASSGRPRAFDIAVDGAAGTLTITINRRMDKIVDGKYLSEVSFPLVFTGVDLRGGTSTTTIMLTVCNKTVDAVTELPSHFDETTGVGYEMTRSADGNYLINAKIKTGVPLDIALNDFMVDPDYTTGADNDSYVFAGAPGGEDESSGIYPYTYLGDTDQTIYWYGTLSSGGINADDNRALATVSPLGADRWHRTGIRISAIDTARSLAAKTYIRVVDRAAETSRADVGVYIILTVEVMNEAPFVKEGMESTTVVMLGSDSSMPRSRLFFIGDFVDDLNESDVTGDENSRNTDTYLRIFSQQSLEITSLYSNRYTTVGDEPVTFKDLTSSSLFSVTLPSQLPEDLLREMQLAGLVPETKDTSNLYNQWFLVTPIEGFFGEGAFELTVSDGGAAHYDALTTTFRINVRVVFNPEDADDELNPIELPCSKSRNVDIATLMPEIENLLEFAEADDPAISARSNGTFSQSEYYTLSSIEFQNSADSSYATISRADDSAIWTITAGNQVTFDPIRVNVRYTLNADPTKVYDKYFWLSVIANKPPKLKYDNITFVRYNRTGDILTDLDDSGSITLGVWQLFSDDDDLQGDALRFVSASSQVPSIVSVSLSEDKRYITIKFAARGKSKITVEVTDETGTPVLLPFVVSNEDMPEGSLWLRMAASFEANKVVWVIAICAVLLLLIILIIVIAVLRKRKRAREELEALLVSEMEIEEQMLRLAGGPAPTDYQSYGYLPPTPSQSAQQNPSFLIGAGENDPALQQMPELAPPPSDNIVDIPTDGNGDI